jgi:hypothetical protein
LAASSPDFPSNSRIEDSYYFEDEGILNDPYYINARDNLYPQFIIDLHRDGGALRIKNTDIAVIFNPNDPAQTYADLLDTILQKLDREFIEDPKLWQFTKRDLRWKLKRICNNEQEEQAEKERQDDEKKKESKKETKVRELAEKLEKTYYFAAMEDTGELFYYNKKRAYMSRLSPWSRRGLKSCSRA